MDEIGLVGGWCQWWWLRLVGGWMGEWVGGWGGIPSLCLVNNQYTKYTRYLILYQVLFFFFTFGFDLRYKADG